MKWSHGWGEGDIVHEVVSWMGEGDIVHEVVSWMGGGGYCT